MTTQSQTIVPDKASSRVFDDDALTEIKSWNDALGLLERAKIQGESFEDYGTGFKVVEKVTLVGTPLMLLEWAFHNGDYGKFVAAVAVAKDGRKVIINDGSSTGIAKQLTTVTEKRTQRKHPTPQAGLYVENGLTRSDYPYTGEDGIQHTATTYYLSE